MGTGVPANGRPNQEPASVRAMRVASCARMGPRAVVVKKGEHGALLISREDGVFVAPAYPQEDVRDPTGAVIPGVSVTTTGT